MYTQKRPPLGCWIFVPLLFMGMYATYLIWSLPLFWHGVTTQGVITNVATVSCGKRLGMGQKFSVRFTDRAGQVHTSTIDRCEYTSFNASPGDSVAIVYLPNDPTVIAPPDRLITNVQNYLGVIIFCGLITLILLSFWIRKRIWERSL